MLQKASAENADLDRSVADAQKRAAAAEAQIVQQVCEQSCVVGSWCGVWCLKELMCSWDCAYFFFGAKNDWFKVVLYWFRVLIGRND